MNSELNNQNLSKVEIRAVHPVFKVTTLSKYLALTLFIFLPFLGGYIGYVNAPEKLVEVESIVYREIEDSVKLYSYSIPVLRQDGFGYNPMYITLGNNTIKILDEVVFAQISEDKTKLIVVHPSNESLPHCGSGLWADVPRAHNKVSIIDLQTGTLSLIQEGKLNVTYLADWSDNDSIVIKEFILPIVNSLEDLAVDYPNGRTSEAGYPCLDDSDISSRSSDWVPDESFKIELTI